MICLSFFSTLISLPTGRTSSWLHLLPFWAILAVIAFQLWIGVTTRLSKNSTRLKTLWETTRSGLRVRKLWLRKENAEPPKTEGTINRGRAFIYTMLVLALTFGLAFAVTRPTKYPIETHHNVYVWSQVKGNDHSWWVSGDDLPLSKWTCCPDFNCTPNVWSGYIAATARYEERGDCKSIRASGLGWFWKRDEFGNVQTW